MWENLTTDERAALIKNLAKGKAKLTGVVAGGKVIYEITTIDNHVYQLEIDVTDKHDVGETATFLPEYKHAIFLMRWFRRALHENTTDLIKLK